MLADIDQQLMKEANVEEKDRFITLMWDEMKVKEGLVFDKHTCNLIGFTNIGQINELDKVQQEYEENPPSNMATLQVLWLYPIVCEAVCRIESCGLNVMAFICDGASPNYK